MTYAGLLNGSKQSYDRLKKNIFLATFWRRTIENILSTLATCQDSQYGPKRGRIVNFSATNFSMKSDSIRVSEYQTNRQTNFYHELKCKHFGSHKIFERALTLATLEYIISIQCFAVRPSQILQLVSLEEILRIGQNPRKSVCGNLSLGNCSLMGCSPDQCYLGCSPDQCYLILEIFSRTCLEIILLTKDFKLKLENPNSFEHWFLNIWKWLDALRGSSPARQINCTTPCNLCNTMQYHNK